MNSKCKTTVLLASLFVLGSCATPMNYVATGGSKSDGTVKLSYEFGLFQEPVVNEQQGLELAKSKCAIWGYSGAEAFGGKLRSCTDYNKDGCSRYLVTAEYQCIVGSTK